MSPRLYSGCTCIGQCTECFAGGDNLRIHQWWIGCPVGPIPEVGVPHDRIPSTTPGEEPPRDARDSGSARSHSTHLETSSSDRP